MKRGTPSRRVPRKRALATGGTDKTQKKNIWPRKKKRGAPNLACIAGKKKRVPSQFPIQIPFQLERKHRSGKTSGKEFFHSTMGGPRHFAHHSSDPREMEGGNRGLPWIQEGKERILPKEKNANPDPCTSPVKERKSSRNPGKRGRSRSRKKKVPFPHLDYQPKTYPSLRAGREGKGESPASEEGEGGKERTPSFCRGKKAEAVS